MGKIIASYLIKAHLHVDDDEADAPVGVTNDEVKEAVIEGLKEAFGGDATVSLIERTDSE